MPAAPVPTDPAGLCVTALPATLPHAITVTQATKVARLCTTNAFAKLLWPVGPQDGGCLLIALALQRLFPHGDLYALWSGRPGWPQPEHVVLRCGDQYLDAAGLSSETELLRRFAQELPQAWLEPVTLPQCLDAGCGVYHDWGGETAVRDLAMFFEHGLGARLLGAA